MRPSRTASRADIVFFRNDSARVVNLEMGEGGATARLGGGHGGADLARQAAAVGYDAVNGKHDEGCELAADEEHEGEERDAEDVVADAPEEDPVGAGVGRGRGPCGIPGRWGAAVGFRFLGEGVTEEAAVGEDGFDAGFVEGHIGFAYADPVAYR